MSSICEELKIYTSQQFFCAKFETTLGEFIKVKTPFLYADGDVISVFVKEKKDSFVVTDLGEGTRWLTGHMISDFLSDKQNEIIENILHYFGISRYEGMLIIKISSRENISAAIINLSQAISKISDISFMFSGRTTTSFYDEVTAFLETENFIFERRKKYEGFSGRNRIVDFYIKTPQCNSLVYALTSPTKGGMNQKSDTINSTWIDLDYLRENSSFKFISLIDDEYSQCSPHNIRLLHQSSLVAFWSKKNEFKEFLMSPNVLR